MWATIISWYCLALLICVVAKFLGSNWGDWRTAPEGLGTFHSAMTVLSRAFFVYRADIIETWLLVGVMALVGRFLFRLRLETAAWISLTACIVAALMTGLALRDTGVPLTHSTLMIAIEWSWQHPNVIGTVLPTGWIIAWLALALAYGAVPRLASGWLSWRPPRRRVGNVLLTVISTVTVALTALALLTPGPLRPAFSKTMSPVEGYWSSTIAALADLDTESPLNLHPDSGASVEAAYRRVAYPLGVEPTASPATVSHANRDARPHVVVIALETAPYAFYRLDADTSLLTFRMMASRSIVGLQHVTTRPYTLFAIYSILTGTYPRAGSPVGEYGPFRNDGLATTLGALGYSTTYIDSYRVDWGYHYRDELVQQGFKTIIDTTDESPSTGVDPFDLAVDHERWSFGKAAEAIADATAHGRRAFVVVATTLGHFPWRARRGEGAQSSEAKVHAIAVALDGVMARFLSAVDRAHERDSLIVVVTGDHGLRYAAEYRSFGHSGPFGDVGFHVPLLIYAPGLLTRRVDIPYVTSHIDIAPTLYSLLGVATDSMVLHGENMLDGRAANRATFMMGTGISPTDAFSLEGRTFSFNSVTHEVDVTPISPTNTSAGAAPKIDVQQLIAQANHVFNLTAAYFLERGRLTRR